MKTSEARASGVIWVLATLAPWSVAPHPNFREPVHDSAQAWALVLLHRFAEFDDLRESNPELATREVAALRDSLQWETRSQGVAALYQSWTSSRRAPLAQRFALAMAVGVLLAEVDESDRALEVLMDFSRELNASYGSVQDGVGTWELMRVATQVHVSLRNIEIGAFDRAQEALDSVLDSKFRQSTMPKGAFEHVRTSQGTSLGSASVQREILKALRLHALKIASRLESFGGNLWTEVVRSPQPLLDSRTDQRILSGLSAFIQREHEGRLRSVMHTRRMYREDPVYQPLYAALLAAEISGDISAVSNVSLNIARVAVDESEPEVRVWAVSEAIRLCRQNAHHEPLKRICRYVRAAGPLGPLIDDASHLLGRSKASRSLTREELEVIFSAADLLPPAQAESAFALLRTMLLGEGASDQGRAVPRAAWHRAPEPDDLWRTLGRLCDHGELEVGVARTVLEYVKEDGELSYTEMAQLERLVRRIDWSRSGMPERQHVARASEIVRSKEDGAALARALDAASLSIEGQHADLADLQGLDYVAAVIGTLQDERPVPDDQLQAALKASELAVLGKVTEARSGGYSFGGYDEGALLVSLCDLANLELPWGTIAAFLTDERVPAGEKELTLSLLGGRMRTLPPAIEQEFRRSWPMILRPESRIAFFTSSVEDQPVSGAAIRAGLALRVMSEDDGVRGVLELAADSNSESRAAAAQCYPSFESAGADNASAILGVTLGLCSDRDPVVRVRAALSLAQAKPSIGSSLLVEQFKFSLSDPGLTVPLSLMQAASRGSSKELVEAAQALRERLLVHPSARVRSLAESFLAVPE